MPRLIIPELLPTTKLCSMYGPGFIYSLAGTAYTNPILAASTKIDPYDPRVPPPSTATFSKIVLELRIFNGGVSGSVNTNTFIIINTTAGQVNYAEWYDYYGLYARHYPCGSLPSSYYLARIDYTTNETVIQIDVFKMLQAGIEVNYIDVAGVVAYDVGKQVRFLYSGTGLYDGNAPSLADLPYTIIPSAANGPFGNVCATSLVTEPNKKRITLNKSTGFVLTVT